MNSPTLSVYLESVISTSAVREVLASGDVIGATLAARALDENASAFDLCVARLEVAEWIRR